MNSKHEKTFHTLYNAVCRLATEEDIPDYLAAAMNSVSSLIVPDIPGRHSLKDLAIQPPSMDASPTRIIRYLVSLYPWLSRSNIRYSGKHDSGMHQFHIVSDSGAQADIGYNQYGEFQWFKEPLTWPFLANPDTATELYAYLLRPSNRIDGDE